METMMRCPHVDLRSVGHCVHMQGSRCEHEVEHKHTAWCNTACKHRAGLGCCIPVEIETQTEKETPAMSTTKLLERSDPVTITLTAEDAAWLWNRLNNTPDHTFDSYYDYSKSTIDSILEGDSIITRNSGVFNRLKAILPDQLTQSRSPVFLPPKTALVFGSYSPVDISSEGHVTVGCRTWTPSNFQVLIKEWIHVQTFDLAEFHSFGLVFRSNGDILVEDDNQDSNPVIPRAEVQALVSAYEEAQNA